MNLRGAGTNTFSANETGSTRIIIQGQIHIAQFQVLPQRTRDIILEWDFLDAHSAIIDRSSCELWMSWDSFFDIFTHGKGLKFSVTEDRCIPTPLTSMISIVPDKLLSDCDILSQHSIEPLM